MATITNLDDTFGAILVGSFIGVVMYGLTVHQTYRYFRLHPSDTWRLKTLVVALLSLDTLHMVELSHICYYYLVSNYFNPSALSVGVWSIRMLYPTMRVLVCLAQGFYARQIYQLNSRYKGLVIVLVLLILAELGLTVAAVVEGFNLGTFSNWQRTTWIDVTALSIALAVDVMVAVTLMISMHFARTGFKNSVTSLVDALITYTINTCVLTSAMSIATLVFLIASPNNLIYTAILIPAARSYANAVLAVLNSRTPSSQRVNRSGPLGTVSMRFQHHTGERTVESQRNRPARPTVSAIQIKVPTLATVTSEDTSEDDVELTTQDRPHEKRPGQNV